MKRCFAWIAVLALQSGAVAGQLVTGEMPTNLLPHALKFTVLLPDGYEASKDSYPLLYVLHGGGGDNGFLKRMQPLIEREWAAGTLAKVVAVTPDAQRSFYMDYKDGSERWETLIMGPFLDYLHKNYRLMDGPKGLYMFGISMGGMGALRMGMKFPNRIGGLAALEPGVDPVLKWKDELPRHRFWRSPELMESIYGKPFDAAYWEANNPATIANDNADRIRASDIGIYIDAGTEDAFGLNEATEFMHQIFWKNNIKHEYHLIWGADHVGRTLGPRSSDGLRFIGRIINPPPPDPVAEALHKRNDLLRRRAERQNWH
jgi:S-formylglutathione hydrolase